jgi:hypothetical protein
MSDSVEAPEERLDRLRAEKDLIRQDLSREGVQLIFRMMRDRAEEYGKTYDTIDFIKEPQKGLYVQCYRDIVLKDIPEFFESIMNHDKVDAEGYPKPDVKPWSFWNWLGCNLRKILRRN